MTTVINDIIFNKVNIFNVFAVIFSIYVILSKNINIFTLIIIFFTFIIQQIITIGFKYNTKNTGEIKYDNLENIKKTINEHLFYRSNLLHSGKMNLQEWIKYNNENNTIYIENKKFYFILHHYVPDVNDFHILAHPREEFVRMIASDSLKDGKETFPYIKEETHDNIINNMYHLSHLEQVNSLKYFWTDNAVQALVQKETFFLRWSDKKNNKTGLIGMGYNIKNVLESNTIVYSDYIHYHHLFFLNLIIFTVAYVIYSITKHKVKALFLLIISLVYIDYYINSKELIGSFGTENIKIQNINSSVLGISFLVGMNVFILSSLKKEIKTELFTESGIFFSLSVILLLFSMFKDTAFMNIRELMQDRISNQSLFNFSILLNLFVIINYILYVISKKNNILMKYI